MERIFIPDDANEIKNTPLDNHIQRGKTVQLFSINNKLFVRLSRLQQAD
ncbi:hypothetical protein [Domibacillus mangrovi]|nr:hypothetical protein [Domibacillus mangrovi]